MKLKKWKQFNEGWSLSEYEEKQLSYILEETFKSMPISNAQFFNSGYKGVSFTFNNEEYLLMIDTGNVGLEDQTVGGYTLQQGGKVLLSVGDDYFSRGFGDVGPTEENKEEMLRQMKTFFKIK